MEGLDKYCSFAYDHKHWPWNWASVPANAYMSGAMVSVFIRFIKVDFNPTHSSTGWVIVDRYLYNFAVGCYGCVSWIPTATHSKTPGFQMYTYCHNRPNITVELKTQQDIKLIQTPVPGPLLRSSIDLLLILFISMVVVMIWYVVPVTEIELAIHDSPCHHVKIIASLLKNLDISRSSKKRYCLQYDN